MQDYQWIKQTQRPACFNIMSYLRPIIEQEEQGRDKINQRWKPEAKLSKMKISANLGQFRETWRVKQRESDELIS